MAQNDNQLNDLATSNENNGSAVHQVVLRIPPFWPDKPELWFRQLEGQFHLNKIKADTTKFWYAVGQLDNRYAAHVEDVITCPPENTKYETLTAELIKRLTGPQQQRIKQLLEHEEIGDRSPSQFLRYLRDLAGSTVQDEFLRTLWLNRLPQIFQAVLATQSDLALDKVADIADRIYETHNPIAISAASRSPTSAGDPQPWISAIQSLAKQVADLTLQVRDLSHRRTPYRQDRSRSRGHRTGSRSQSREHEVCWFHRKFGNDARNCRAPCNFHRSGNGENHH